MPIAYHVGGFYEDWNPLIQKDLTIQFKKFLSSKLWIVITSAKKLMSLR